MRILKGTSRKEHKEQVKPGRPTFVSRPLELAPSLRRDNYRIADALEEYARSLGIETSLYMGTTSRCPTNEPYLTFGADGVKQECYPLGGRKSKEEAISSFLENAMIYMDQFRGKKKQVLYWRWYPKIEQEDGKFLIWARFVISEAVNGITEIFDLWDCTTPPRFVIAESIHYFGIQEALQTYEKWKRKPEQISISTGSFKEPNKIILHDGAATLHWIIKWNKNKP